MIGQKFNNLTVIRQDSNRGSHCMWVCRCDCGIEKSVRTTHLKSGSIKSCGCLKDKYDPTPGPRTCIRCEEVRQFPDDFAKRYGAYSGKRYNFCDECRKSGIRKTIRNNLEKYRSKNRQEAKNRRQRNQIRVSQYLNKNPCVDCGESDFMVLQFDHVRGVKKFQITNGVGKFKWETIEAEIAKCDVRCANCHQRKTILENGGLGYVTRELLNESSPLSE